MIGAATARLRYQKQRDLKVNKNDQRKSQSPTAKNLRRRSQSPGPKNQPNSLLSTPKTELRRGSYHALLTPSGPDTKTLKPPSPFPQRKRSGSVPVIKFTLVRICWFCIPYIHLLNENILGNSMEYQAGLRQSSESDLGQTLRYPSI